MESKQLRSWETAVDVAENNHLTAQLPADAPAGTAYLELGTDNIHRRFLRCDVVGGNPGARWAYWNSWKDGDGNKGIGPHPNFQIVVDGIFNGDATHFCGMLAVPYGGQFSSRLVWVLIEPRVSPPPISRLYEEKSGPRYERSREVYDVETGETKTL